jgi:hypothetical protein
MSAVWGILSQELTWSLGPIASMPFPVVSNIPSLNGKSTFGLENRVTFETGILAFAELPFTVTFETVTPKPANTLLTNSVGVKVVFTKIGCANETVVKATNNDKVKSLCIKEHFNHVKYMKIHIKYNPLIYSNNNKNQSLAQ